MKHLRNYETREYYDLWKDEEGYYFNNCCVLNDILLYRDEELSYIKDKQSIVKQLKNYDLIDKNIKTSSIAIEEDICSILIFDNRKTSKTYGLCIYFLSQKQKTDLEVYKTIIRKCKTSEGKIFYMLEVFNFENLTLKTYKYYARGYFSFSEGKNKKRDELILTRKEDFNSCNDLQDDYMNYLKSYTEYQKDFYISVNQINSKNVYAIINKIKRGDL